MSETRERVRTPWWSDAVMYWLEDQVTITFHSAITPSFYPTFRQGVTAVIDSLHLKDLNQFLNIRGFNLRSFDPDNTVGAFMRNEKRPQTPDENVEQREAEIERAEREVASAAEERRTENDVNIGTGKYLFTSPSGRGTTVVSFFKVEPVKTVHVIQDTMSMGEKGSTGDSNARQIVNLINRNLDALRHDTRIPILAATPNWLGGANCFSHGCPVFPPFPVPEGDSCSSDPGNWSLSLPDLAGSHIEDRTGDGVTVFVLDTMPLTPDAVPDRSNVIGSAAQGAGRSNVLLNTIATQMDRATSPFINFYHLTLPDALLEDAPDQLVTGRDIHGKKYGFYMPDHGLFVTGIIRSLAPNVNIEYVRVLNDFGVGDTGTLVATLEWIQKRMSKVNPDTGQQGDLYNKHVVINLSLVMTPSDEDLLMNWFSNDCGCNAEEHLQMVYDIKLLRSPLHHAIQSLTASGAVIVGSAGNDSNTPDMPERIGPRYPAAFPEVISVGAVDGQGNMAPYSNYPQLDPQHNGIATYGGSIPTLADIAADNVDALIGIYSSSIYPALEAKNPPLADYSAPNAHAWAYWAGTSFATPIISAVVARILEHLQSGNLPARHVAAEVQWALTTAAGQQATLGKVLGTQSDFGVSLLQAVQCRPVGSQRAGAAPAREVAGVIKN